MQICHLSSDLGKNIHAKNFRSQYMEYAGLEISVDLSIASPFSRQIAKVNAGPSLALTPMGAKRYFRCHSLNITLKYKQ